MSLFEGISSAVSYEKGTSMVADSRQTSSKKGLNKKG